MPRISETEKIDGPFYIIQLTMPSGFAPKNRDFGGKLSVIRGEIQRVVNGNTVRVEGSRIATAIQVRRIQRAVDAANNELKRLDTPSPLQVKMHAIELKNTVRMKKATTMEF